MRTALLTLAILLTFARPAQAWDNEPTAVLGVVLGANISDPGIPTCASAQPTTPCVRVLQIPGLPARYSVEGHPFPYASFTLGLTPEKTISSVNVWMKQNNFQRFADALTERYGSPSNQASEKVSNLAGAQMDSAKLFWIGKAVSISAMERAARMDESAVIFLHNDESSRALDANRKAAKDAAGKL